LRLLGTTVRPAALRGHAGEAEARDEHHSAPHHPFADGTRDRRPHDLIDRYQLSPPGEGVTLQGDVAPGAGGRDPVLNDGKDHNRSDGGDDENRTRPNDHRFDYTVGPPSPFARRRSKDAVRRLVCFDFPLEATQPMNIREVMTPNPQCVSPGDSIQNAARIMRDCDTGAVPVVENGRPVGILTDRDIVVRSDADGCDPNRTTIGAICSRYLSQVGPDDPIDRAVEVMRETAVRRLPVVDREVLVGIVSLGDLAEARDPRSALSGISSAQPNT